MLCWLIHAWLEEILKISHFKSVVFIAWADKNHLYKLLMTAGLQLRCLIFSIFSEPCDGFYKHKQENKIWSVWCSWIQSCWGEDLKGLVRDVSKKKRGSGTESQ